MCVRFPAGSGMTEAPAVRSDSLGDSVNGIAGRAAAGRRGTARRTPLAVGLAVVLVATFALAGCGRRSAPESPPGVKPAAGSVDRGNGIYAPPRKFILDPLL